MALIFYKSAYYNCINETYWSSKNIRQNIGLLCSCRSGWKVGWGTISLQRMYSKRPHIHITVAMISSRSAVILLAWCQMSNSLSMTALAYMTVFDISYLLTAALSLWTYNQKPSPVYSFGYERFEVSTQSKLKCLVWVGRVWLCGKEAFCSEDYGKTW